MRNSKISFSAWKNKKTTIHKLFKLSATNYPKKIAITYKNKSFSYRNLDKLSNNLAAYLQRKGLGKGSAVGVLLEKSPEYIIACLKWSGLSRQKIIKNERENFKKIIIENGLLLV